MYMAVSIPNRESFEKVGVGYLYRILNNRLVESYGEIKHRDEWYYDSKHYEPKLNIFVVISESGTPIAKELCAGSAGEVLEGKVWLYTPDRAKAAELLMNYEQEKIDKLIEENKRAVAVHVKRIDILMEEV